MMDTITYIVILGLCFLVIDWLSYGGVGEGVYGRPRSRLWKKLGRIEIRGLAVLENRTIFMDTYVYHVKFFCCGDCTYFVILFAAANVRSIFTKI